MQQPTHDDHRGHDEAHVLSLRLALGSILSPVSFHIMPAPLSRPTPQSAAPLYHRSCSVSRRKENVLDPARRNAPK